MTAPARKPKPAKKPRKPVYLMPMKVVRMDTGEEVGAFVPASSHDARVMRERKYRRGQIVRAMITRGRNFKFHKLAHAIGELAIEHIEGFEEFGDKPDGAHLALKRLQRESGVCCEESQLDLGPLGLVNVKTPQSIAYDEMEPEDFELMVKGICNWIKDHYHGVPPGALSEIIAKVEERG